MSELYDDRMRQYVWQALGLPPDTADPSIETDDIINAPENECLGRPVQSDDDAGASDHLTVERCREILASSADGQSDEQLQRLVDTLTRVARAAYDEIARLALTPNGIEHIRWSSYMQTCTPEEAAEVLEPWPDEILKIIGK